MAFLKSIYYSILENIRDIKISVLYLIFPLILIIILGNALSGFFSPNEIKKTTVIYIENQAADDNFNMINIAFEKFMNSNVFRKFFLVKSENSEEAALKILKNSGAIALIELKKEGKRDTNNAFKVKIISKDSADELSLLKSMVQNFLNNLKLVYVLDFNSLKNVGKDYIKERALFEVNQLKEGQYPRAIDYYAVTMLVMIVIYGLFGGMSIIEAETTQGTFVRLICSSKNLFCILLGKGVGNFLFLYIQSVLVVLFSKLFFKVNWGQNIFLIFLVLLIYQLLIFEMGLLLRILIKSPHILNSIVYTFATISTFLIGGYVNISISSGLLQRIRAIFPNYSAQTLFFTIIYDSNRTGFIRNGILQLCIYVFCITLITIILIWRRKRWLYSN